jgi:hypothetical protein
VRLCECEGEAGEGTTSLAFLLSTVVVILIIDREETKLASCEEAANALANREEALLSSS